MSNTIKLNSAVLLESPKGYGILRNNTKNHNTYFKNAITIYGKKHLLNALFSHLTEGSMNNKIPQLSGLSILFRRCGSNISGVSDAPTKDSHKLTKGFFEHIYLVHEENLSTVGRDLQQAKLGASIDGSTCEFRLDEVDAKSDAKGSWGATTSVGTTCLDPTIAHVWHGTPASEGDAPKHQGADQCLKEESSNAGFGYAKIAGISVLTSEVGIYSGGAQVASEHSNIGFSNPGNTIKVWRDPTFMELIHQQESLRAGTSVGGIYGMPQYDSHTAVSLGHYFPNLAHFTAINNAVVARDNLSPFQLGDPDLIGSCSGNLDGELTLSACSSEWTPSHNVWEWKHTAIDTFAFSGFVSHWYGANEGTPGDEIGSPFISLDMSNRTAGNFYNSIGWVNDATTGMATGPWYKPIARQAGNFLSTLNGYDFPGTVYWAWSNHDNAMTNADVASGASVLGGDGLLPDTLTGFEIDYDKGGSQDALEQENFIDHNDTLSTKYTINFAQSASYETALTSTIDPQQNNALGDMVTTIDSTLGEYWANDFGRVDSSSTASEYIGAPKSAIHGIRLLDKSGRCMACSTDGSVLQAIGSDANPNLSFNNSTNSFSAHILGKMGESEAGKSVFVRNTVAITNDHINDKNVSFVLDSPQIRPRMLINTINLFFNQLEVSVSTTGAGMGKPHKLELYGSSTGSNVVLGDLLFTFILGSSEFADNIADDNANPFFNAPNADNAVGGDILGNATAGWTNGNHLDVTLKFVMV